MTKKTRDIGVVIGTMEPGARDQITDVPGVAVGHYTLANERHNTGVTVVMPCADNPFINKLPCAAFVLNGFGKTAGLMQIDELGTLETPIALTNTLNVGKIHDALVGYMIDRCGKEGVRVRSVNPVVCECNDAGLNDITLRELGAAELTQAIDAAGAEFAEGAVGAGRGMTCHGMKGGIGSASRIIPLDDGRYTLGVMVLTNHGNLSDFTLAGDPIGPRLRACLEHAEAECDKGSCIVIMATDLPLSSRQLGRVIKRASVGLARIGSFIGHGSGEVLIGFSTANRMNGNEKGDILCMRMLREDKINLAFRAVAEATEEAVLNSLLSADGVRGWNGEYRYSLTELMKMAGGEKNG